MYRRTSTKKFHKNRKMWEWDDLGIGAHRTSVPNLRKQVQYLTANLSTSFVVLRRLFGRSVGFLWIVKRDRDPERATTHQRAALISLGAGPDGAKVFPGIRGIAVDLRETNERLHRFLEPDRVAGIPAVIGLLNLETCPFDGRDGIRMEALASVPPE